MRSAIITRESDPPPPKPSGSESPHAALSPKRRVIVTLGIMLGMVLASLEATAVSAAMPTVVSSLGGLGIYSWVFSVYFLTSTLSIPVWGKLSDIYGRKIFYLLGITIFMLGSGLSGQSQTMTELIISRAVQGVGAGALLTLGMIIIGEIFSLQERARVQGLFGGIWGISSIAGPLIGGFITDNFSWRWVFYLNIPFGVAAAIILGFALREQLQRGKKAAIDYLGAGLLAALSTLLVLGITELGRGGTPIASLVIIASCLPLGYLFILVERMAEDPVLPLDLFSNAFFKTSAVTGFFVGMAMFGSISFIPLFAQGVTGASATVAGGILTPLLLSWVTLSSVSGKLMLRFGYRPLIFAGTATLVVGFSLLSQMDGRTTQIAASAIMIFLGCGIGMIFIPTILAVQNSVPRDRLGIATSATQFFRLIGGAVGTGIMGAVMAVFMRRGIAVHSANGVSASEIRYFENPDLILNPIERAKLSPETLGYLQGTLAHSLRYVFIAGLVIAILAFASALLIPKKRVK
ncbi:MAG: MDR family MFS transporter [Deltaproteobacteria bacterium]